MFGQLHLSAVKVLAIALLATAPAVSQDLVLTQQYRDTTNGIRTGGVQLKLEYYNDGLIKSYLEQIDGHTARSFTVDRKGDELLIRYGSTDNDGYRISRVQLTQTGARIVVASPNGSEAFNIRRSSSRPDAVTFCQTYDGKLVFKASFGPELSTIKYLTSKQQYAYRVDPESGVPTIVVKGQNHVSYELKRTGSHEYSARVTSFHGLHIGSYRIQGVPVHCTSFIAVLNLTLVSDPQLGTLLFPFLGGLPDGR